MRRNESYEERQIRLKATATRRAVQAHAKAETIHSVKNRRQDQILLADGGTKARRHCEVDARDELVLDGFIGSARFSCTCEVSEPDDEDE